MMTRHNRQKKARHKENRPRPFAEVVTCHQHVVYGYLLRFTRNAPDAQDLFQETFLRAYRAYASLPPEANHRAWLVRIATNLAKNSWRDRQRHSRVVVGTADSIEPLHRSPCQLGQSAEDNIIARETVQHVLAAIDRLPFRQRAALLQRQFAGLDYDSIAANLDCSPATARAHVYQALRKLRLAVQELRLSE